MSERLKLIPAVHVFLIRDGQVLRLRRFNLAITLAIPVSKRPSIPQQNPDQLGHGSCNHINHIT